MVPKKTDDTTHIAAMWMKTARILKDRIFLVHKAVGINPQQMYAAFMIYEHEGLTMKELAEHLGITSPSTTSLVNRLVRLKWVSRMADPSNRKLVRLKLAPDGKKILTQVMKTQSTAMGEVLSLLSVTDRTDFARILSNLHDALVADMKR